MGIRPVISTNVWAVGDVPASSTMVVEFLDGSTGNENALNSVRRAAQDRGGPSRSGRP